MELYNKLNEEFKFDTDASDLEWGSSTFCSPTENVGEWIIKSYTEATKGKTVVLVITLEDTKDYSTYIYGKNEIRFILCNGKNNMVIIWK